MIPFDNLTRAGKLRRLHALAQSALASFDLADPVLEFHCLITNVHYGKEWTPPPGFTQRRFEHWLSRGEPNALLDPATINRGAGPRL